MLGDMSWDWTLWFMILTAVIVAVLVVAVLDRTFKR